MKEHGDHTSKIQEHLQGLEEKYELMGQDMASYLEGLLHAQYLTYWDYINLDTLLSLQQPRTVFPDENVFILYHQITELYFKAILLEIKQTTQSEAPLPPEEYLMRVRRINRYFRHLVNSFDVMVDGMEVRQFLKFRMTLLPASGFQSAQMRKIEFCCTDALYLVAEQKRGQFSRDTPVREVYQDLYWRFGATELKTGKPTLTLRQFEEKYKKYFIATAEKYRNTNLWQLYLKHYTDVESTEQIQKALRELDALANVDWRLAHYKSAIRYLQRETETIEATGGTNWQKYLPPRFQRQQFFPELWSEDEKAEWGKRWVVENVGQRPKK